MKKLALIAVLFLAASPAAAQLATSQRVQRLNGQSVQSTPTVAPTTGVFCIEEMTATFCNVVTGPNTSGYGSRSVSTSSSRAAVKRRICIERRPWCHQSVDPTLLKRTAVQRTLQLTKQRQQNTCGHS